MLIRLRICREWCAENTGRRRQNVNVSKNIKACICTLIFTYSTREFFPMPTTKMTTTTTKEVHGAKGGKILANIFIKF